MLKKLLNLLPAVIVRQLGDNSFASLQERGEVKTWIVGYTKDSSLPSDNKSDDLIPGNYYYLGLQIRIVRCFRLGDSEIQNYWDWFVYDGYGSEIIANGESLIEEIAITTAQKWIDDFLCEEDNV